LILSVVIPVRDKARFLGPCVGSILSAAREARDVEVILVENGSSDGSEHVMSEWSALNVVTMRSQARTAGRARNEGAAAARGDVLCFLDADVVVPAPYFDEVRRLFGASWVDAAGCTVELPTTMWIERVWGQLHAHRRLNLDTALNGANLCVTRPAFDTVGGFDQSLVTGEDADLCLRLVEKGGTIVESPRLSVLHMDNPATLAAFFRKELWHGLGAFATARRDRLDKPLLLTIVYAALVVGAFTIVIARGGSLQAWFVWACVGSAVPVMAVAYRWSLAETPVGFFPAVVLYHVYFLARGLALLRIALGQHRQETSPRHAP